MSLKIKKRIKRILRTLGYDLHKVKAGLSLGSIENELLKILNELKVDIVLDIGANKGQFTEALLQFGFDKTVISFEPISHIHSELEKKARSNENWHVYERCCLGDVEGEAKINISNLVGNSSILPIKDTKFNVLQSHYVNEERVKQITLATLNKDDLIKQSNNVFIKMDIQGYEQVVLNKLSEVDYNVVGLFLELSLFKLYDGQEDYLFTCNFLKKQGYDLVYLAPESIRSNRMIQINGIFLKKELSYMQNAYQ